MRGACAVVGAVVGAVLAAGCAGPPRTAALPSPVAAVTTPAPPTTQPAPTAAPGGGWPAYASAVSPVTAARLGPSWHRGCPVEPAGLRAVRVRYAGFDGRAHDGELVVASGLTGEVAAIFAELYRQRFPVRLVRTVDAYRASDDDSMAADNTSAFNCRPVTGGTAWSEHAYGRAIDLNPRENPYVSGRTTLPPDGVTDRSARRPGMVTPAVLAAFARRGWTWGGSWPEPTDYQHFQR